MTKIVEKVSLHFKFLKSRNVVLALNKLKIKPLSVQ